jgi:hypothetical protein
MIDNEYEFRRGYNYGFSDGNAEGKAWEQRRIIKLLEDRTDDSGSVLDQTGNSIADLSDLIELIKGETNE